MMLNLNPETNKPRGDAWRGSTQKMFFVVVPTKKFLEADQAAGPGLGKVSGFRLFKQAKLHLGILGKNSLVMNAFYLMLSTFVVAASGLIFWVTVTKTHSTSAVGLATTLLSVSSLLALLSLAGFDTTFVRFLPGNANKNAYINSGFIVVAVLGTLLATCVAVALPLISPSLTILHSPWAFGGFIFFTATTALNTITNAVFLAFKRAFYIFVINTLFSLVKIILPFMIISSDAFAIFVIAGLAQLVGVILSIAWMHRAFGYAFSPRIHMDALRAVKRFSLSVYSSSVLNLLPPTLLPLIIVYYLGTANVAYYYMAFTVASVLYTIAYASTQSVFAEGSHDESAMGAHLAKAAKLVTALLVPAAVLTIIFSEFLLRVFGHDYARHASGLLQFFVIAALPVALYSGMGAIFKVTKQLRGIVWMNGAYATVILGFSFASVPKLGLIAVGWAWIAGNVAACLTGAYFLIINKREVR